MAKEKGTAPSKDCIPVGPIRRILQEYIGDGAIEFAAFEIFGDVSENGVRLLRKILEEQSWITLDRADLILSKLELNHLTQEDPELKALFDSDVVAFADERAARLAVA